MLTLWLSLALAGPSNPLVASIDARLAAAMAPETAEQAPELDSVETGCSARQSWCLNGLVWERPLITAVRSGPSSLHASVYPASDGDRVRMQREMVLSLLPVESTVLVLDGTVFERSVNPGGAGNRGGQPMRPGWVYR